MRLVWTTDPHLNHVSDDAWERWIQNLASHEANGVVITGDISEGDDVIFQLHRIAQSVSVPIYFVLGNHDFYQSSIGVARQSVIRAAREHPRLNYLTDQSAVEVAEDAFLVGEDGWCDATVGDYDKTTIRLNDFVLIDDFASEASSLWKQHLRDLGAESAQRLAAKLSDLPSSTRSVLVATHVPPFREACWYEGKTTDDNWAPFFVCGQLGDTLRQAAQSRPNCQFVTLCGHTHNAGVAQIEPNLVVHTGAADYGRPDTEGIVNVESDLIELTRHDG